MNLIRQKQNTKSEKDTIKKFEAQLTNKVKERKDELLQEEKLRVHKQFEE